MVFFFILNLLYIVLLRKSCTYKKNFVCSCDVSAPIISVINFNEINEPLYPVDESETIPPNVFPLWLLIFKL